MIYAESQLLKIQIDSDIWTKRIFDESVNYPIILFVSNPFQKIDISNICVNKNEITINDNIKIVHNKKRIKISIENKDKKELGIMFPVVGAVYFGHDIHPIQKSYTYNASYNYNNTYHRSIESDCPVLCLENKSCIRISTENPCMISYFHYKGIPYANIVMNKHFEVNFDCFASRFQAIQEQKSKTIFFYPFDPENMKKILLYNLDINLEDNSSVIMLGQEISSLFKKNKINHCFVGSFAANLYEINQKINDIDIFVDHIKNALDLLKSEDIHYNEKWGHKYAKVTYKDNYIDLMQPDVFDWNKISEINLLPVIEKKELIKIKLFEEIERNLIEPYRISYGSRNRELLLELIKDEPMTTSFLTDFIKKHTKEEFYKIKNKLIDTKISKCQIKTFKPLLLNKFERNNCFIIPIINSGSKSEGIVKIDKLITKAIWTHIGEKEQDCLISTKNNTSIITLPMVMSMGVLELET